MVTFFLSGYVFALFYFPFSSLFQHFMIYFFNFCLLMSHLSLPLPPAIYLYSMVARFFLFHLYCSIICDLILYCFSFDITSVILPLPLPPGIHCNKIGFFSGIRTVFTFRPYLLLFLVQLFGWLGVTFIQGNYALYIKYALDMEALYPYVIAVLLIATIMWMPLWQLLMRRIGKKASLTVGLWMFMVIILSLLFIDFAGDYGVYLAFPLSVIGGAGVAAGYLFPW